MPLSVGTQPDKGANAGLKVASLVAGMVAGADSIDDMALLRHGGMGRVFAGAYAPSTLGSFLRTFSFGHVRQLDAVASRLLGRLADTAPLLTTADPVERVMIDIDDTRAQRQAFLPPRGRPEDSIRRRKTEPRARSQLGEPDPFEGDSLLGIYVLNTYLASRDQPAVVIANRLNQPNLLRTSSVHRRSGRGHSTFAESAEEVSVVVYAHNAPATPEPKTRCDTCQCLNNRAMNPAVKDSVGLMHVGTRRPDADNTVAVRIPQFQSEPLIEGPELGTDLRDCHPSSFLRWSTRRNYWDLSTTWHVLPNLRLCTERGCQPRNRRQAPKRRSFRGPFGPGLNRGS